MTLCSPSEFISIALTCPVMAVDTETNGKDIRDGRGFAIGISAAVEVKGEYYSAYFPVAHEEGNVSPEIKEQLFGLIASRDVVVFHNAKFDIVSLGTVGYNKGFRRYYCTLLMAHLLNENVPKSLDWLAKNELKESGKSKPPEWEIMFTLYGWSPKFPASIMALYASEDAILTLKLFKRLYPFFKESGYDGRL